MEKDSIGIYSIVHQSNYTCADDLLAYIIVDGESLYNTINICNYILSRILKSEKSDLTAVLFYHNIGQTHHSE